MSDDTERYKKASRFYRSSPSEYEDDTDDDPAAHLDYSSSQPSSNFWASFVPKTDHLRISYSEADRRLHGEDPNAAEKKVHEKRMTEAPFITRDAGDENEKFWFNIVEDNQKALLNFLTIVERGICPRSGSSVRRMGSSRRRTSRTASTTSLMSSTSLSFACWPC